MGSFKWEITIQLPSSHRTSHFNLVESPVCDVSISEDDSVLASGALDGSVKVFSFPQLVELHSFDTVLLGSRFRSRLF